MKNRTIGLAGIAFAALCLAIPTPAANAAEGDPFVVLVEAPVQTCVPGEANDDVTQPKIITGVDVVDAVVEPTWHLSGGSYIRIGEVYPQPDAPNWVYDPASWMGDTFVDDGSSCGQEPELILIDEPTMPGTIDDPTKQGDAVWDPPADDNQHTWVINDKGELIARPAPGKTYGEHEFVNFGTAPDVFNPPVTPSDPPTTPSDGGGTGNDGSGGDNGGSTPPASTPDTNTPSTGGQVPTSGSDDKSGADKSKGGKKSTATNQVRRPGHNGAVAASDSSLGFVGWSASALALTLAIGGGYLVRRRRAGTI